MTVKANHPFQRISLSLLRWIINVCTMTILNSLYGPNSGTHRTQMPYRSPQIIHSPILIILFILVGILFAPQPAFAKVETDNSEEIVFIDTDGFIRVLDIHQVGANPLVKWVGGGSKTGKLAIYDPVVAAGGAGKPQINEIPWDTLYTTSITGGKPLLVGAGNLDAGIPGDEIVYVIELEDAFKDEEKDVTRATIIKPTTLTPDGRSWQFHIEKKHFDNNWSQIDIANVDLEGADEVAFANEDEDAGGGKVELYRIADGLNRIWNESSNTNPWRSVALGQIEAGGPLEMVITRKASKKPTHMFVYRYQNGTMVDYLSEGFTPYPRFSILADVNGSGDDEIFMLRRDSDPRLIMRNRGGDGVAFTDIALDEDGQYRTGTSGDVDGDGKDELLILRPDRLRLYTQLDLDASHNDYNNLKSDRVATIGDLDKIGFVKGPELRADKLRIEATIESGKQAQTQSFIMTNVATAQAVPLTMVVEGNPSWVVARMDQSQTPATIFVAFNANQAQPGIHKTRLIFTSSDATVTNQPYVVELSLTIVSAEVIITPQALIYSVYPCESPMDIQKSQIEVTGSGGVRYTATVMPRIAIQAAQNALEDEVTAATVNDAGDLILYDGYDNRSTITSVFPDAEQRSAIRASSANEIIWSSSEPWVSASSLEGSIPDILTLTIDANEGKMGYQEAMLLIVADNRAGARPSNVRFVDMSLMCAQTQLLMPYIAR